MTPEKGGIDLQEEIEKYLSQLNEKDREFFATTGIKQIKRNGTIEFEVLLKYLQRNIENFSEISTVEKIKNFMNLWTIEADLDRIIEGEKSNMNICYNNGRARALSDVFNLIYMIENQKF